MDRKFKLCAVSEHHTVLITQIDHNEITIHRQTYEIEEAKEAEESKELISSLYFFL